MYKNNFPILLNNPELIYFDNAATSQKPVQVITAIVDYYENYNANVHRGNYAISEKATEAYESARRKVARFINSEEDEIVFTSGTTDGINKLALSLERHFANTSISENSAIFLTEAEHHSNLIPWQQLALRTNLPLIYIKLTEDFRLDLTDLREKLRQYQPIIFAFSAMSNVTGVVAPVHNIIQLVRKSAPQTVVVVDAAQYAPHVRIDVKDFDCDALVFSGHKMFAPTGIGALYIKSTLFDKLQPVFYGGGMIKKVERIHSSWETAPHNFEPGTPNIEGAISLGTAIDYINSIGFAQIAQIELDLTKYFLEQIKRISEFKLFGPIDTEDRGPVFSFKLDRIHAHDVATLLDQSHIAVRSGHHCTQIMHRELFKVAATTRASLNFINSTDEIDRLMISLREIYVRFSL